MLMPSGGSRRRPARDASSHVSASRRSARLTRICAAGQHWRQNRCVRIGGYPRTSKAIVPRRPQSPHKALGFLAGSSLVAIPASWAMLATSSIPPWGLTSELSSNVCPSTLPVIASAISDARHSCGSPEGARPLQRTLVCAFPGRSKPLHRRSAPSLGAIAQIQIDQCRLRGLRALPRYCRVGSA